MAARPVKIELNLDDREAKRKLQETASEIASVEESLGTAESAGKQMARAIEMAADDMITEIDETRRAVDALERALGPDFDADTREVVADLKAIGLTARDIEADADELAAALKRSGEVKVHATSQGFDDLGQAVGSVREETGRTKDTMSGFIGGTIGELPGISSALGPVSEGLGQLTEGALNGEVAFKNLALAGGAMGAVGLGVQLVVGHFQDLAAVKAWEKERVEEWTDAVYDAEDAVSALADTYRNTGEVEVKTLLNGMKDITSELARAGITIDDWTFAVQGGNAEVENMAVKLAAAGLSSAQAMDVLTGLTNAQKAYKDAVVEAAERTAVFGSSSDNAKEKTQAFRAELDALNTGDRFVRIDVDLDDANRKVDEFREKLRQLAASGGIAGFIGTSALKPADVTNATRTYTSNQGRI